jgi:DDRGK domain-containing protein 1
MAPTKIISQELESSGRLSGILDDRGKFIYITPEESKAVADFIM